MVEESKHRNAVHLGKTLALSVAVVLFLEVFVFNFAFWESLTFGGPVNVPYTVSKGLKKDADSYYQLSDKLISYIELECNGQQVNNVELQLRIKVPEPEPSDESESSDSKLDTIVPISFSVTDAGNAVPLGLPWTEYCQDLPTTHYVRLHIADGSETIRVRFDKPGTFIAVDNVAINAVRPFDFSLPRVLLIAAVVALVCLFRPSSRLYRVPFNTSRPSTVASACLTATLVAAFMVLLVFVSDAAHSSEMDEISIPEEGGYILDFNHYNHLADALIAGSASLDLPVSETMKQLDNPYDRNARMRALSISREHAYMDYAYYNGKYYCYFGPLPAVLAFVPYKLATGHDLRTDWVVAVFAVLCTVSLTVLSLLLYRRFFKNGSLGLYLLGLLSLLLCCGTLGLAFLPTTYSVPILSALFFASAGLCFWVSAKRDDDSLSVGKLAIGGLLIALTLGCRPSFVAVSLLAFPLFWNEIKKERLFFARTPQAIRNTLATMMPFVVVALPIMAYNFVRFGSVTDFGASYNITGADMTHRGFMLARIPGCLFEYLFQPLNINLRFPYIHGIDMATDYQGLWFFEPYLGGFFAFAPICFMLLLLWVRGKAVKQAGARGVCVVMIVLALVFVFLDFQVASITKRYFGDFGWLLLIATWLVVWSVVGSDEYKGRMDGPFGLSVVLLAGIGLGLTLWALLSEGRYGPYATVFPEVYYTAKAWFASIF